MDDSCGVPFTTNLFNSCGVRLKVTCTNRNLCKSCWVPFNSNLFNSYGVPFNRTPFNSYGVPFNSVPFNSCRVPFNSDPFDSCGVPFKSSLLIFPVINSRISIPKFLPRRQRHLEQLTTDVDVATSSSWEKHNCSHHSLLNVKDDFVVCNSKGTYNVFRHYMLPLLIVFLYTVTQFKGQFLIKKVQERSSLYNFSFSDEQFSALWNSINVSLWTLFFFAQYYEGKLIALLFT